MATIKFVNGSEKQFLSVKDRMKIDKEFAAAMAGYDEDHSVGVLNCRHHDGGKDEPELFEVQLPPNQKVAPHAHDADEIIYIVDGELHFGRQVYGGGSSVFVPKMTLYGFETGPQGATFLNFRPVRSPGGLTKEQFMAARKSETPA